MSELTVIDETGTPQPVASGMPMKLIEMAVQKGSDIEQLQKLMDMQERWEAREARKAYLDAFSEFQSNVPRITKNKEGHNYQYAALGDIAETIKSALQDCGLSYRFEIQDAGQDISVTCIVSHRDGHQEQTAMTAAPDTSGSKTAIQARASAVSYLQRYSLIGALGLTTADADIDARSGALVITDEQSASIKKRLEATGSDVVKFCKALAIQSVDAMPKGKYAQADASLTRKEASHASS